MSADIERIKNSHCIGRVVGRYVNLSWKGSKATGLCPFHDDHHPSLQVDTNKQSFVCYACGEKGDVIEFVRKYKNCSFREALKELAPVSDTLPDHPHKKTGPVPAPFPHSGAGFGPHKNRLSQGLFGSGGSSYSSSVKVPRVNHQPFLDKLMPYISGIPELSPTYLHFEVGVAPMGDRHPMRGRIIFPVRDEAGVLQGFSGRGDSPKYLNTSSEEGFHRSRLLYGLYQAQPTLCQTGTLYLVEGFKDVIAMHAAGLTGTVGLMGTAMTEEQVFLIRIHALRVVVVMDGDRAGQEAAGKITERLQKEGIEVTGVCLPESHDPDSLFRKIGKEGFRSYIEEHACLPHLTEERLLYACLRYRDVLLEPEEGEVHFVTLVHTSMVKEELPFGRESYNRLLAFLQDHGPDEELPEIYRPLQMELEERYGAAFNRVETPLPGFLRTQFSLYAEYRLERQVKETLWKVQHAPSPEERYTAFHHLSRRRALLNYIRKRLC